jgi:hypothetical protein
MLDSLPATAGQRTIPSQLLNVPYQRLTCRARPLANAFGVVSTKEELLNVPYQRLNSSTSQRFLSTLQLRKLSRAGALSIQRFERAAKLQCKGSDPKFFSFEIKPGVLCGYHAFAKS